MKARGRNPVSPPFRQESPMSVHSRNPFSRIADACWRFDPLVAALGWFRKAQAWWKPGKITETSDGIRRGDHGYRRIAGGAAYSDFHQT